AHHRAADAPGGAGGALDALLARGIVGAWSNRLEAARRDLEGVRGATGSIVQSLTARAHLADVHLRRGDLVEAADVAADAVQLLEDAQAGWLAPLPHSIAAYVHTASGDFARAEEHAQVAHSFARAAGDAPAMVWAEAAWLRLAEAQGDHE